MEVCHAPTDRIFPFPEVRNVNRVRIANGFELRRELKLNTGRYDRPAADDPDAVTQLGLRLVSGDPVHRFQFEFTPRPVVLEGPGDEPFIGPHSLAHVTGISRHQVYRAIDVGAVDTFVSHWKGRALSYVIVNDRLAFWLWAYAIEPAPAESITLPAVFNVGHEPDLFDTARIPQHVAITVAVKAGDVPGKVTEDGCTVNRGYPWVRWLASRRLESNRKDILTGV